MSNVKGMEEKKIKQKVNLKTHILFQRGLWGKKYILTFKI